MSPLSNHLSVRKCTSPEDQLAFQRCMATAFLYSYDGSNFKPRTEEDFANATSETWVSGTPMHSGYVAHDFDVWFDGKLTTATGIGGVSSMPEGRGQGGIRSIFEVQLPDSYERGYVFSILFPFSHVFYRKFGYELAQKTYVYKLPINSLKPFVTDDPITVITHGPDLAEIHDAFGRMNNLCIRRKEKQWHFVSADPAKDVKYTYKIGDRAFVCFRPEKEQSGERMVIKVTDLGYKDVPAFKAILGFLYTLRAQFDAVTMLVPDSIPVMEMIPECYEAKTDVAQHGMARIVNVKKALELMNYPKTAGSFTVRVSDEQIAQNNATFKVEYADGIGKVTLCEDETPDLTATIQRLTQLVVGSLSIREIVALDGVTCPDTDKLSEVFRRKDVYFDDPF